MGFECVSKDKTDCGEEYSTAEQLPFCAIQQPSRFAPIYDLSGGLNDTEWVAAANGTIQEASGGGPGGGNIPPESLFMEPIVTSTQFMWTGKTAFGEAAMNRLVRQPDLTALVADPTIQAQVEVCSVWPIAVLLIVSDCGVL
jgi:hypothetical protein